MPAYYHVLNCNYVSMPAYHVLNCNYVSMPAYYYVLNCNFKKGNNSFTKDLIQNVAANYPKGCNDMQFST
jgi:hypothetical protein